MSHIVGREEAGETGQLGGVERCVQLSCRHCFHDLCINGWTLVGKKDTCPLCGEKVDMRALKASRPWDTRNLAWIQMLDAIRYMVVWNPIIFTAFSAFFHIFMPHHTAAAHGAHGAGPPPPPPLGDVMAKLVAADGAGHGGPSYHHQ